ncbi:MAG: PEGA domain-containing protein [Deltaproteobacteria bacterium]|nr:PEGA domain-containing protein [Deltaproteobacteria bacterium]
MRPCQKSLLPVVVVAAALTAGCGSQPQVLLRFSGEPADALVTINDEYIGKLGRLARRGIKLPPGDYRVTVEQTGYFPFDKLVRVTEESPPTIAVELTEEPD